MPFRSSESEDEKRNSQEMKDVSLWTLRLP